MDIDILEDKKNRLVFNVKGNAAATLVNALRKELWQDEKVKVAGYNIDHPLVGSPQFILETTGVEARKALKSAVERLSKDITKLQSEAKKLK